MRFVTQLVLALSALALVPSAAAQASEKTYRLAILSPNPSAIDRIRTELLPQLARHGFAEGRNLRVDFRTGNAELLPKLAADLVASSPDAIFATSNVSVDALLTATKTLPIVVFGQDPVGAGYAVSLARPGGQVTGVAILTADLDVKRLELLRDAVPGARRAAVLIHKTARDHAQRESTINAMAAGAGMTVAYHYVARREDYALAFAAMREGGTQVLVVSANSHFVRDVRIIGELAQDARLPTVCEWKEMAASGCLFGYGPSLGELLRLSANYIARIFRGANPGELPIAQPANFELGVNMHIARALGVAVPTTLLLRADEVIE